MNRLLAPLLPLTLSAATALGTHAAPPTLLQLAGVHPAPAHLSDATIIVIDAQADYLPTGRIPLAGFEVARAEIQALLRRARAAGTPIVHIQQTSPHGRGAFELGSPGAEFVPEARPAPGESVITKRLPNAFAGTSLDETLRALRRSRLVIVGAMTHMCVSATARAALDHGYETTVVASACATRDLPDGAGAAIAANEVHRVALAELRDRFATVVENVSDIPD